MKNVAVAPWPLIVASPSPVQGGRREARDGSTGQMRGGAKCTLKNADREGVAGCSSSSTRTASRPSTTFVKNEASQKASAHTCSARRPAVATGKVMEKDGRSGFEATKIEAAKA